MASEALGSWRMFAHRKEEVIRFLAASDVPPADRRRWFREWCNATRSSCLAKDIDRVGTLRPRKQVQLGLFPAPAAERDGN